MLTALKPGDSCSPATRAKSVSKPPVCVVVGVGSGSGEAIARRFARAGHAVALLARGKTFAADLAADLPGARAYRCDATDEAEVARVFAVIAEELGPVDVLVYNLGKGVWGAVDEIDAPAFELAWRTNAFGLFLTARQVMPAMASRKAGSIIVIGATASRRGVARTAAFAPAKMAQRALAESMARHLGASGVHVALVIIDGVVDGTDARERLPGRGKDEFVAVDEVAATVWYLSQQERSAWTFELDLRPYSEQW